MVELTAPGVCDHPSLEEDGFSFPILPTSDRSGSFIIPLQRRSGSFFSERDNRYCLWFFRYQSFCSYDEHPSRPKFCHFLWSWLPGKSSLISILGEETLLFTDGQRKKKKQTTLGLELLLLNYFKIWAVGAARNQPHDPFVCCFPKGFRLGAEHNHFIFKQEFESSNFSEEKVPLKIYLLPTKLSGNCFAEVSAETSRH